MKIWKLFSILLFLSVGLAACALQAAEPQVIPPSPVYTATLTPFQPGTSPIPVVEGQAYNPAATEVPEEKATEEPTKLAEAEPTSEPEKTATSAPTKPPAQATKVPTQKPTSEPTATKSTNPTSGPTATPKSTSTPKPTKTPAPPTATSTIPAPADPTATKTPIPTNTSVPPTKVPPTSPPPSPSCSPGYNSGFESEVISLINAQRANLGLSSLSGNGALGSAARSHSTDMACNNFFSHTGSDGSNFVTRVSRAGYGGSPMGETIAAGYGSPSGVVDGWMNSPPHREILMNPNATQIGVGYAYTSTSAYGSYWTAVTGR